MKQKEKMFNPKWRMVILLAGMTLSLLFGKSLVAQQILRNPSFDVTKTGTGRPMILIPGLFCSGKVWDETVEHFRAGLNAMRLRYPAFRVSRPYNRIVY